MDDKECTVLYKILTPAEKESMSQKSWKGTALDVSPASPARFFFTDFNTAQRRLYSFIKFNTASFYFGPIFQQGE